MSDEVPSGSPFVEATAIAAYLRSALMAREVAHRLRMSMRYSLLLWFLDLPKQRAAGEAEAIAKWCEAQAMVCISAVKGGALPAPGILEIHDAINAYALAATRLEEERA